MNDICLIVCFYKGDREANQQDDFNNYIYEHISSLNKLEHNLSKIIFVISQDNIKTESVITKRYGKIDITYYYRKNLNLSFGGWVDVMLKFKHDYYILCEDDYIFTKNNFDKILLDTYNKYNVEYLVTWHECNNNKKIINYNNDRVLISTIGILSKKYIELFVNYNDNKYNKGDLMLQFLTKFKTISCLDSEYNLFPYWKCYNHKISPNELRHINCIVIFDNNSKEVTNENEIDYNRILVSCYQFVVKNKDKLFLN